MSVACAICLDSELRHPTACVPCGHSFCLLCIAEWVMTPGYRHSPLGYARCPQCRTTVVKLKILAPHKEPGVMEKMLGKLRIFATLLMNYVILSMHDAIFGVLEAIHTVTKAAVISLFEVLCVPWILLRACFRLGHALVFGATRLARRVSSFLFLTLVLTYVIGLILDGRNNIVHMTLFAVMGAIVKCLLRGGGAITDDFEG